MNPIWGSSGRFCGHDFGPDFGHHFDDTILGLRYQSITKGRFQVIVLMTEIGAKIPTGNQLQGAPKMGGRSPNRAPQIVTEMPPMPTRASSGRISRQPCGARLGSLANRLRRNIGLLLPGPALIQKDTHKKTPFPNKRPPPLHMQPLF